MSHSPRVTVLMPVYDAELYLHQSIRSILDQTFQDFELLIISEYDTTASSIQILQSYSDPRMIHIHNAQTLGLPGSRNVGLEMARGEYVALMDADDVSMSRRLQKQVRFMDAHADVGVVGTGFVIIDQDGRVLSKHVSPSGPDLMRWRLMLGNPIANPSVMMRRAVCKQLGGYTLEPRYAYAAEDYELWLRALQTTKIVNLGDVLLGYRRHEKNITRIHERKMLKNAVTLIQKKLTDELGRRISLNVVRALVQLSSVSAPSDALDAGRLVYDLCRQYIGRNPIDEHEQNAIRLDAAYRLSWLAAVCLKMNPLVSVEILRLVARLGHKHMQGFLTHIISTHEQQRWFKRQIRSLDW